MQIFANLAKICRGNFASIPLHQTGGVMQRLAEEFHKLLVAGSNRHPSEQRRCLHLLSSEKEEKPKA